MYKTGLVRGWVYRLIFFDLGAGPFLVAYVLFLALIVLPFRLITPVWSGRSKPPGPR